MLAGLLLDKTMARIPGELQFDRGGRPLRSGPFCKDGISRGQEMLDHRDLLALLRGAEVS